MKLLQTKRQKMLGFFLLMIFTGLNSVYIWKGMPLHAYAEQDEIVSILQKKYPGVQMEIEKLTFDVFTEQYHAMVSAGKNDPVLFHIEKNDSEFAKEYGLFWRDDLMENILMHENEELKQSKYFFEAIGEHADNPFQIELIKLGFLDELSTEQTLQERATRYYASLEKHGLQVGCLITVMRDKYYKPLYFEYSNDQNMECKIPEETRIKLYR